MPGFGYFDASEYEPQLDSTSWIIQDILPRNAFGFVAGPPKGNASPHGGKSVLQRKLALSVITGNSFFGKEVIQKGRVMFVNLDEDQDKQVRLYYRMTRGEKIPGYLISKAKSCRFNDQMPLFEADVRDARPLAVMIDPLQRVLGSKDVKNQADVGPIINELKRISRTYSTTIIVSHHSNKYNERDKESTASWLNGSVDLDAAWDFCLCPEYHRQHKIMHLRNFQKEKAKVDIYYEAEIVNKDEIIDLNYVIPELISSQQARTLHKYFLSNINKSTAQSLREIEAASGVPESTIRAVIRDCAVVKSAHLAYLEAIETNKDNLRNGTINL